MGPISSFLPLSTSLTQLNFRRLIFTRPRWIFTWAGKKIAELHHVFSFRPGQKYHSNSIEIVRLFLGSNELKPSNSKCVSWSSLQNTIKPVLNQAWATWEHLFFLLLLYFSFEAYVCNDVLFIVPSWPPVTSSPSGLLNTCSDRRQLSATLKLTGRREYLHETQQLQLGLESDVH